MSEHDIKNAFRQYESFRLIYKFKIILGTCYKIRAILPKEIKQ